VTRAAGCSRAAALARAALVLASLLLASAPAFAHTRSISYSLWEADETGARVRARIAQLDLSRLGLAFAGGGSRGDPIGRYLAERLRLSAGGAPCEPSLAPATLEAPEGFAARAWRVECRGSGPRVVESDLLLDVAPSHLHMSRVTLPDGTVIDRVLFEAERRWTWPGPATSEATPTPRGGTDLTGDLALGVEHILTGWDHLAFVLALLLLAATFGEVAALVTSFTVAHSVTLGLATLGVVRPEAAAVEALIGFSIALVAAENGWILAGRDRAVPLLAAGGVAAMALLPGGAVPRAALLGLALFSLCHFGLLRGAERPARLRVVVAFAFGLVHGFGFAGVLAELELPTERLVPALFGFNAGVEIGQLAVVALLWPLLRVLARPAEGRLGRLVAEVGSAAICGLGLFWFVTRSLA
jgi:hypothetical protein